MTEENSKCPAAHKEKAKCPLCETVNCEFIYTITEISEKEKRLGINSDGYLRSICLCRKCDVFFNWHNYDMSCIYEGTYHEIAHGKIVDRYLTIRRMPEAQSINKQRVRRIVEFVQKQGFEFSRTSILDVGSGLCVFSGELKDLGFRCYCIDPDPCAVKHAEANVKVDGAFCGTMMEFSSELKYDIICFNKVLEHIKNPAGALSKAKDFLNQDGFVYIELPDAYGALGAGTMAERPEFFAEHYTVFTEKSLKWIVEATGFQCIDYRKIHEPGDKFTLYAFLKPLKTKKTD